MALLLIVSEPKTAIVLATSVESLAFRSLRPTSRAVWPSSWLVFQQSLFSCLEPGSAYLLDTLASSSIKRLRNLTKSLTFSRFGMRDRRSVKRIFV